MTMRGVVSVIMEHLQEVEGVECKAALRISV